MSTPQEALVVALDARWSQRSQDQWARVELGLSRQDLAALVGVPCDRAFNTTLWSVCEAFRAKTNRQIVIEGDRLVVLSAQEQIKRAKRFQGKARRKARRAVDMAARVPLEQLPEGEREAHVRRVEKMSQLMALEEVVGRKRDVLAALDDEGVASATKARAEEARSRGAAFERLFQRT